MHMMTARGVVVVTDQYYLWGNNDVRLASVSQLVGRLRDLRKLRHRVAKKVLIMIKERTQKIYHLEMGCASISLSEKEGYSESC